MTHVRTSPYYPQSNGKLERFHATIKGERIRPGVPLSFDEARTMAEKFIAHCNHVRLHSAIGYVAPADKLHGREQSILKERDRKLEEARDQRKRKRHCKTRGPAASGEQHFGLFPAAGFTPRRPHATTNLQNVTHNIQPADPILAQQ